MTLKRKEYSKQFKEEVVREMETGDKSPVLLARELGVRRNQLYKWPKQVRLKAPAAFPGSGMPPIDTLSDIGVRVGSQGNGSNLNSCKICSAR